MFITKWSNEEDDYLNKNFVKGEMKEILKNLPRRSESAIRKRAAGFNLHRRTNDALNNDHLISKNQNKEAQVIIDKLETLYSDIDRINILSPEYAEHVSKIDILEIKLLAFNTK